MRFIAAIIFFSLLCSCTPGETWISDFNGKWEAKTGEGIFYETWESQGDHCTGSGCEINQQGDTLFVEKLELIKRDGKIIYVAHPGLTRTVEFTDDDPADGIYRFSNATNDYPSTIEYKFNGDELKVVLSGMMGEDPSSEEYAFIKSRK